MLPATFCHLKNLPGGEHGLWESGILTWTHYTQSPMPPLPSKKDERVRAQLAASQQALEELNAAYFLERLPALAFPRIYPHFKGRIAYLDIETTGLEAWSEITTIAVYDGTTVQTFVRGVNLDAFAQAIGAFSLVVTYNGARFDLPFIRRSFGLPMDMAHLDLMRTLRSQGFSGGLKVCEQLLGIRRQVPEDMNGFQAVQLWHAHRAGDAMALPKLLAYNAQDVLSLELLLVKTYNASMRHYPLFSPMPLPTQPRLVWPD
jgi:hypothetical protein